MTTIHAIYENGVFRPTEPVQLPDGTAVEVTAPTIDDRSPGSDDPRFAHLDPGMAEVYAALSQRFDGGDPDGAARHNEHQP